jgi:tol-pal system protein YbgF
VAAFAALPLLAGCVTVAEFRKLERDVSSLRSGGGPTGGDDAGRVAELAARLDGIEIELQRLSGRLEVAEHQAEEAVREARAAREAAAGGTAPAAGAPTAPAGEGEPAAPGAPGASGSTELDAYRDARSAWSRGDADECIDRFREFLQTYPSSSYAENASYWMADCYFKRGDFKTAVLRFDDVVARYPSGERAPDALYRQGEALLRLGPGYGKAAGKAFERVVKEYPDSARAAEAKKQLELLGAG